MEGMNEDTLARDYDPAPFLKMFSGMFGQPTQHAAPPPMVAPSGGLVPPATGVNMVVPGAGATTSPAVPVAQPSQTPYSAMLQPQAQGGAYGVDSTQAQGGTGKQPTPEKPEDKGETAPLSPQMLQMLQAMMPKPPLHFLAPAGHLTAGTQTNLSIPGAGGAPTLGQLLRGG